MAKVTIRFHETTPQQRRKMLDDLAKRVNLNESLEGLLTSLRQFEDTYGMSTVEFYARFMAGKMGDARDFIEWAGDFIRYQRLMELSFKAGSITRWASSGSSPSIAAVEPLRSANNAVIVLRSPMFTVTARMRSARCTGV
jgi:hypothetical protein